MRSFWIHKDAAISRECGSCSPFPLRNNGLNSKMEQHIFNDFRIFITHRLKKEGHYCYSLELKYRNFVTLFIFCDVEKNPPN